MWGRFDEKKIMSMPIILITCSKCQLQKDVSTKGVCYVYQLSEEELYAPHVQGWCKKCRDIQPILLGLSTPILSEEVNELNKTLEILKTVVADSFIVTCKIRDMEYEIEKKEKYLRLLDGKTSKHQCLKCGSLEVIPYYNLSSRNSSVEDTCYTHISCGGRLQIAELEIQIAYIMQKVIVDPEF